MKRNAIMALMLALVGLISGCASAPQQCNLSGSWNYTFEETGRDGIQNGSMKLVQEGYTLRGESSDAFGTFVVTGVVTGAKFTIDGRRIDGKRTYHLNAMLNGDNNFEGSYTTNQNTSGTLKGSRITAL